MLHRNLLFLLFTFLSQASFGQDIKNEFFAFLNMMDGDTISKSTEQRVTYIQSVGYDGIGIDLMDSFEEVSTVIKDYDFKSSVAFLAIDMDTEELDVSLKDYLKFLKSSKSIIAPSFYSSTGKYTVQSQAGDDRVKQLLLELAQFFRKMNLAIYPHYGYYVQSHKHAYRLVKEIGKMNIGYCFNLSHWLAVEDLEGRNHIKAEMMESISKLKVITINGANKVISEKENPWDDYILPLGEGTFDVYEMVDFLISKLKYNGPIGVQCQGLKGDKMQMAEDTMLVWKSYLAELNRRN